MLEHALKYAKMGLHVIPLQEGDKLPLKGSAGYKDGTIDPVKITKWWSENPKYNIGIVTGLKSGFFSLDIDRKGDKNGFPWVEAQGDCPATVEQITPSTGHQKLFSLPDFPIMSVSDKLAYGVDTKGEGGYIVAPPSYVKEKKDYPYSGTYEWVCEQSPFEMSFSKAPEWLLDKMVAMLSNNHEVDASSEYAKSPVSMVDVMRQYNIVLKGANGVFHGAHPVHGSSNGMNFRIDTNTDQWACYRHTKANGKFVGGGPLQLIAVMEGIICCEECAPKALAGDKFIKVLDVLALKFGVSKESISEDTLDQVIESIQKIRSITERWDRIAEFKKIVPKLAKLPSIDYQSALACAQETLGFKTQDISSIKKAVSSHKASSSKFDDKWDTDENGNLVPSYRNLINILSTDQEFNCCFRKNTFSEEIDVIFNGAWEATKPPVPRIISNSDASQVKLYIIQKYNIEYTKQAIDEGIDQIAIMNHYNPVKDYIEGLEWDGVSRLETWLSDYCGVVNNTYTRWVGQTLLVAAIKRALYPGCKYDHVVVFAGDQSIMKSTLVGILGNPWFNTVSLMDKTKDTIQKMQGQWFIEIAEGVPLGVKSTEELKAFVTETFNRERFAYERRIGRYERKSVFVLTINPKGLGYLLDPTGNRRFLPIRMTGDVNINGIKEVRNQLFAEAKELERKGFRIYIGKEKDEYNAEIIAGLENEHSVAEVHDGWFEIIRKWLAVGSLKSNDSNSPVCSPIPDDVSITDIWCSALNGKYTDYKPLPTGHRIAEVMRKLGCAYQQIRIGHAREWRFSVKHLVGNVVKDAEEVVKEVAKDKEVYDPNTQGWVET